MNRALIESESSLNRQRDQASHPCPPQQQQQHFHRQPSLPQPWPPSLESLLELSHLPQPLKSPHKLQVNPYSQLSYGGIRETGVFFLMLGVFLYFLVSCPTEGIRETGVQSRHRAGREV